MSAASIYSTTGTVASVFQRMAQNGRPDVDIVLDNHKEGKTYTTFDAISGKVNITAPQEARFDEIHITFEGTARTAIENLSPHTTKSRTTARHNFLKLTMPIRESDYPQPRVAEAGRTYIFPFNFVVPDQLLPRACSHATVGDHVQQAHIQLLPSMGDRALPLKDDLSPDMAIVDYAVRVKVVRNRERDNKDMVLVDGLRRIHIVPAVAEAPPLNIRLADKDYTLSKTKSLKKGMFSGKLGKITVSAEQPGALVIPAPASKTTVLPTTMATINLRFDPHDASSQPPRLGGLTTKIKSTTFFSTRPAVDFPAHFSQQIHFETTRGIYDTSVSLSSRCVESVAWTQQCASPAYRRGSSSSTSSSDDHSDCAQSPSEKSSIYYTASIVVPITLPASKRWIPTFHSCITSRAYIIGFSLTIHTPGTGVPASTVNLHVPVQIAADANNDRRASLTDEEAAIELAAQEAEEYLRPRVLEVPREELIGRSVLGSATMELPPSYEDFAPRRVVDPGRG
ncbi:hypothetical protein ONS95_000174 [Cadophora gregata]|uniref:uncharacterized protein n=1 Tax=Cadophora gregata TaxID=51156 RepID=UPI0026DB1350|nr:uncharacterized protein ONS95_000174 [Cadophora gregata]KAK0115549.1 hypothetical protein ONS96_014003 [Cadophora gregata f. sp. sojae]KAK0128195.1 hypothetical protein ONS95_000174 [Cadophora gregata]